MPFLPHRRQILLAAAAAVASLLGATSTRAAEPARTDWPRQKRTPPVQLPMLDGTAWTLAEQRGHAVLLNFWASWCEPCVTEMPSLARMAEQERPGGLRVVAANYREPADAIRHFVDHMPLPLDIGLDADGSVARSFGVHAFPSTVAIGADGRVRFVVMGECDWTAAQSRHWLDELLGRRG